MPELVIKDLPATSVKPGHTWLGSTIETVKVGRKWVTVTLDPPFDGKREWPLAIGQEYEIGVMERTAEEQAVIDAEVRVEREQEFIKSVRRWADSGPILVEAAERRQAERRASGWEMLDHWVLDGLLQAWAIADLASIVRTQIERIDTGTYHMHPGECKYTERTDHGTRCVIAKSFTEFEAFAELVKGVGEQLVSMTMQSRVLSRSTSVTSNLCEDLKVNAHVKFIESFRWDNAYLGLGLPCK